jgi:hypothetical protein
MRAFPKNVLCNTWLDKETFFNENRMLYMSLKLALHLVSCCDKDQATIFVT